MASGSRDISCTIFETLKKHYIGTGDFYIGTDEITFWRALAQFSLCFVFTLFLIPILIFAGGEEKQGTEGTQMKCATLHALTCGSLDHILFENSEVLSVEDHYEYCPG